MLKGPEPETLATGWEALAPAAPAPLFDAVSALTINVIAKRPVRTRYTVCASATSFYIGAGAIFFRKFCR